MFNIGGEVGNEERWEALDKFATRILTSGYEIEKTRQILLSGIRGYEGKIKRRLEQGVPIYRTAEESGNSRNRKKILGKSTWLKGGKKNPRWNGATGPLSGPRKSQKLEGEEIWNRSVIFVEHTPGGELAKQIRNTLARMEDLMGFKIKVVERAGMALKDLFSPTNI